MPTESFSAAFGTPALPDNDDTVIYVLATEFFTSTSGSWTGIEWFAPGTADAINHYIVAYTDSVLTVSKLITPTFGGGLQTFNWNTPIAISPGHTYEACVLTQRYSATIHFFDTTDATTTHLTAPHATNGRLHDTTADTPVFPDTLSINSATYHVSPVVSFTGETHSVSVAASLGLATATTGRKGASKAVGVPLGLATAEAGHKLNASVSAAGLLSFTLAVETTNPEATARTGSWYELVSILEEAAAEQRWQQQRIPSACPNDGEPLRSGPDGGLYCPYDGWRWDG